MTRTLILGLGNLIQSDDGVGVRAVRRLLEDPRVPPDTWLLDGGTLGLELLSHVAGVSRLLILDAVNIGVEPGTLVRFGDEELRSLTGAASAHELGVADLLLALRLMDRVPEEMVLLGVQEGEITVGDSLSPAVEAVMDRYVETAVAELSRWTRTRTEDAT